MTKVNESFSAFIDGEASEIDVQRMLNAMEGDPSVVDQWHRLSCAKAVLNDEEVSQAGLGFSAVSVEANEHATKPPSWLPKTSVAALLAVAISSGYWALQTPKPDNAVPQISINNAAPTDTVLAASQFQAQQRLEAFLKQHIEQASFSTGHGVIPSELTWTEVTTPYE